MSATKQLHSLEDTAALARRLAGILRMGDVVTVTGDLGAGKTTFAQYLIGALSAAPVEVTSPTFTLLQTYPVTVQGVVTEFYHYDLYRIEQESALIELGFDEALHGITMIEWPERLGAYRLPVSLALSIVHGKDGGRSVCIDSAAAHLKDLLA